MKHKIILVSVTILLGVIAWYFRSLLQSGSIGLCNGNFSCESILFRGVAWPFINSSSYLIVSTLILAFIPYSFLKIWLKIMIPYFIIALILVIETPALCGGMICFDRTLIASGLAKLFLILTILIILSKSLYLWFIFRRNKRNI
jgi:hypothetical protein